MAAAATGGAARPEPGNAQLDFVEIEPQHLDALIRGSPVGTFLLSKGWPNLPGCNLRACTLHGCEGNVPVGAAAGGGEGGDEWQVGQALFDDQIMNWSSLDALLPGFLLNTLPQQSVRPLSQLHLYIKICRSKLGLLLQTQEVVVFDERHEKRDRLVARLRLVHLRRCTHAGAVAVVPERACVLPRS